jgi:hypothetical protein
LVCPRRKRGRREKRRKGEEKGNEGGTTMVGKGPVFSHLGMVNIQEGFSEVRMGVGGL